MEGNPLGRLLRGSGRAVTAAEHPAGLLGRHALRHDRERRAALGRGRGWLGRRGGGGGSVGVQQRVEALGTSGGAASHRVLCNKDGSHR